MGWRFYDVNGALKGVGATSVQGVRGVAGYVGLEGEQGEEGDWGFPGPPGLRGPGAATIRIPILGWSTRPDDTGDCFFEPYDILATSDVWKRLIGRCGANNAAQPTVRAGVHGGFVVPKDYLGTAKLVIVWTATLVAGNVVWDFDYRTVAGDDTTSLDQAGTEEAVTVTDTAPGAAHRRLEVMVNLTSANFAVDDEVEFFFGRDGVDAADTMAGSAILFELYFQYANS